MRLFSHKYRMLYLIAALTLSIVMLLVSSCAEEPPPVDETENPHEALFNILYSENNHTNNLSARQARDFYANGFPSDIAATIAESPSTIDIKLTASADKSVFSAGAEYADFAAKFLRDSSLNINSKRNPVSKDSITNIGLYLSGQKLASADILIEGGERFSVKSEELYPKYIAMDYADFFKILADATQINFFSQIPQYNFAIFQDKYSDLLNLTDISADRIKTVVKPFVDKLSEVIADENIAIDYDVSVEGIPGAVFKKVSVYFASEDLRQVLTALIQTAKENSALLGLIKEKYTIIYDGLAELAEIGIIDDLYYNGLPPAENIDNLLQSSFAALEVMLGSASGLPVKALAFDFYLDGTVLKCARIGVWTVLPENANAGIAPSAEAAGAPANAGQLNTASGTGGGTPLEEISQPGSASIIQNAGNPAMTIIFKSFDDEDKWRNDSLSVIYEDENGEKNTVSLSSKLLADKSGGSDILNASFDGPALDNRIPDISVNFDWDNRERSFTFITGYRDSAEKGEQATRFSGNFTDSGAGGYDFTFELGVDDPDFESDDGSDNNTDSNINNTRASYAINMRCEGSVSIGQTEIPAPEGEDVYYLVQDSFYDGTFENIFNEFYANLIRFASANRQLLSLYGFPGF